LHCAIQNQKKEIKKMIVGKRIRICRQDRRITQDDLSKILGVDRSTIASWETARTIPDLPMLIRLAAIFDTSLDYLAGREGKLEKLAARINCLGSAERKMIENLVKMCEDEIKKKQEVKP
jgi:transcriptional regulator with XRE-family HTH domain